MADEATENKSIKEIEVDGYKFTADMDLLDDVEAFEIIDRIENKGQVAAIVPMLLFLIGKPEYDRMKLHFSEQDAAEHKKAKPEDKDYKPRFRVSKLQDVYLAIIAKYDPKD